jgi:uncharacterized C2H2 Zn-finger protein
MIAQQARRCPSCQQRFASRRDLTRHQRETHPSARPPTLIRLARALRALHQEQIYAMECLMRLTPAPEADPLTWIRTRSGYSLAGRYLPTPPGQAGHNSA